jgi:hypothetical protein
VCESICIVHVLVTGISSQKTAVIVFATTAWWCLTDTRNSCCMCRPIVIMNEQFSLSLLFNYTSFFRCSVAFWGVGRRAPQQMLRTHRSLKAYCATLWWRWLVFCFSFFQAMEHRWNEIDRAKPKYSGGKPCPSATLFTTNPTWTDRQSNPWEAGD